MNFLPFYYGILIIYGIAFYFIEYPFMAIFLIFAAIPLIDENMSSDFENPVKGFAKYLYCLFYLEKQKDA